MPVTLKPSSAKTIARGSPAYPSPTIPTVAVRARTRSSNADGDESVVLTRRGDATNTLFCNGPATPISRCSARPEIGVPAIGYNRPVSLTDSVRVLVEDGGAMWGFLLAATLVLALTPVTAWLAPRIGAVDTGGDRPRVHTGRIPRIGGG